MVVKRYFQKRTNTRGEFRIKCYRCRSEGHVARNCPEPKQRNPDGRGLLSVAGNVTSAINMWCWDSGCTAHMCSKREKFTDLKKTHDCVLNLANNASTVEVTGSVILYAGETGNKITLNDALLVPDFRTDLVT